MTRTAGILALAFGAALLASCADGDRDPEDPATPSGAAVSAGPSASPAPAPSVSGVPAASPTVTDRPMLADLRSAAHPGFDRVVLEFTGPPPGHTERLAPTLVQCGSGRAMTVPGARFLVVTARPVRNFDDAGRGAYAGPRQYPTPALTAIEGLGISCDWEGEVSVGVGLADPDARYTVSTLTDPSRIVIDVRTGPQR